MLQQRAHRAEAILSYRTRLDNVAFEKLETTELENNLQDQKEEAKATEGHKLQTYLLYTLYTTETGSVD